jgi:hypothetical protein
MHAISVMPLENKPWLPRKPQYQWVLLARGELHQPPKIFRVRYFPVFEDSSPDAEWTWMSRTAGLTIMTSNMNRETLHSRWMRLASRCRRDVDHFDSLQRYRSPIVTTDEIGPEDTLHLT